MSKTLADWRAAITPSSFELIKAEPLVRSAPPSVCIRFVDKYVVGDAVPGAVNADEKQQGVFGSSD
jgi:hypothetical protein